ncbi:TPA: DEAD/DEAH box helicase family protein, partial [Escherichia coli]|nr:DEAD/DEAH box helicase family protein [Escherichia coli]
MQRNLLKSSTDKIRKCQEEAVEKFFKFKKKNIRDKACLINLPTGAGKTGVISLISHLSKERNILIICHRRAVKEQLYREVSSRFFRVTLNDPDIKLKNTFKN